MRLSKRVVELDCSKGCLLGFCVRLEWLHISEIPSKGIEVANSNVSWGVVWINIEGELEILEGAREAVSSPPIPLIPALEIEGVGFGALRGLSFEPASFGFDKLYLEFFSHPLRDLALDCEYVDELLVVALGPDMTLVLSVYELN